MIQCPQCHQPIDGIQLRTYGVGWCRADIHTACLPLHVRACPACRPPNADYLLAQLGTPTRKP